MGVGAGIGLAVGLLMAGCPADVNVETVPVPVPGGDYGISVAPSNGPVSGGTTITFTSLHGGFDARTSVLFGEQSATEVHVYNDNVMTAMSPPGSPGSVSLRLHAPVDSSLHVMIDDQGAGTIDLHKSQPIIIDAGNFEYYVVPPVDGTDSDGDGLTNEQEIAGWEVWTEQFGLGLGVDNFGNVTRYRVTSDPNNADTDGDGLTDNEEFLIRSDPQKADTDGDGLWDGEERKQWLTSPTSVDSDSDARGNRELQNAPNPALFDGAELFEPGELKLPPADRVDPQNGQLRLRKRATSPTLADTDGDNVSDYDELDSTVRNGVIADLPLLNYQLVGDVDVRLNVEYAESIGETKQYGTTLKESRTETTGSTFSGTVGWSLQIARTIGIAASVFGPSVSASVSITQGFHAEVSYSMSRESSQEASRELSRVESDSREFTETTSDGTIRTAIMLTNGGNTTFSVNGLTVLVSQLPKQALGTTLQPRPTTIATLKPVFESTTLAPGESAGPFELSATGINAQSIKALLAAPDTLMLGTASMDFTDSNGLDFDYVRQFTAARTAHVVIDFGGGDVRQYNVATNVDRDANGKFRGIKLSTALDDYLGFPAGDPVDGFTTRNGANGRSALESLLNYSYRESGGARTAYWDMVVVKRNQSEQKNPDFNNVVLEAGDYVHLMYQEVAGQSGVTTTVAKASGIDQIAPVLNGDADGDTLSNQDEILQGWVAFASPGDTGIQWAESLVVAAGVTNPTSVRPGHPGSGVFGAPDPATGYGSSATAWSPLSQNGTLESIEVRVATSVYSSGATIRETWGNGFVYQVDLIDGTGVAHTVWKGTDPSEPGAAEDFKVTWPTTDFLARRIKVYIDTDANLDTWEEIDAIALHGFIDKRAHRVYSDPRLVDTDGDGLTDAEEKAGVTRNSVQPAVPVSSDPLDPDTDGDSLPDGEDPFPTVAARIIYVMAGTPTPNNGNTWETAYTNIQAAVTRAVNGQATPTNANDDVSQIWVAAGRYKPANRTTAMRLANNLQIYGGFHGPGPGGIVGETKRGQRNANPLFNGCVITGDLADNDTGFVTNVNSPGTSRTDNAATLISSIGATIVDSSALLDGFALTGACKTDQTTSGALYCGAGAYPTIQNCLFVGNASNGWGGGFRVVGGGPPTGKTMVLRRCVFANNIATLGGGAYVEIAVDSRVLFEDCQFTENQTRTSGATSDSGGGVFAINFSTGGGGGAGSPGPFTFTIQPYIGVEFLRCAFTNNRALNQGGAIATGSNFYPYIRIDSCRFIGNLTLAGTQQGSAVGSGGALSLSSYGSVSNSLFWDNRASSYGGAISVVGTASGSGTDPTISANITITNCTLAYNRSLGNNFQGGGIVTANNGTAVAVQNTILWQNYFGAGVIPDAGASNGPNEANQIYRLDSRAQATLRNNCLNGPPVFFAGNGNFYIDPKLAGPGVGDLRLSDDSPCIDRANTFIDLDPIVQGWQQLPLFDLAGQSRIVDGNSDGIVAVDIGAYEAPPKKE